MKQLVIALFALISVNVSAQTLYDRVEEIIVKPLEKYGIQFTKNEGSLYHIRKDLMFTIPLLKSPDATTNSSVEDSTMNASRKQLAEQFQEAYETLSQGLQQLRKSALESYWWEKNDCDSLMISMSWNPKKDNRVEIATFRNMPRTSGTDYIQVVKMFHDNSDNLYVPRCQVMFNFAQTIDSVITGRKPFDIQAYKKFVEPAFKKKGIVSKKFDYRYSKNYLQKHPELYSDYDGMEIPDLCAAYGDVHFIPKDMAMQFIKEFKELTHTYLDSHYDEAYIFHDFSYNTDMQPTLQNSAPLSNNSVGSGADSSHPLFRVWVDKMEDGRFAVIMKETYGRMRINFLKEYWKYKTINDDKKVEY